MYYGFIEETSVRLTVASEDDVCATVSVHNYSVGGMRVGCVVDGAPR